MIGKTELAKMVNISPMVIVRIEKDIPCRKNEKREVPSVKTDVSLFLCR